MVEISTSLLNAEKGKEAEIILGLEKARTDRNEYYPKGMPESYQEISDWWNGGEKMNNRAKRLIVFAPDAYPWTDIAAEWSSVVHIASKAGEGLREVELEVVLACIAGSI